MTRLTNSAGVVALCVAALVSFNLVSSETSAEPAADSSLSGSLRRGTATPQSMGVLGFAPDGTLFIGDSKGGAVFAVETGGIAPPDDQEPVSVRDVESKIAARLGAEASDILVHDMAVHPISHVIFLAVSRGRANWDSPWKMPNHVADADILLTIDAEGSIDEFSLEDVRFARVELSNPVDSEKKHPWMPDLNLRTDTITDMAYTEGTLFVAGLSNEDFASTLWRVPLPFADGTAATTLEIYHGAHGAFETQAPIRTFVPYSLGGEEHILAAYLCTPLSLFKVEDLEEKQHLRGRTVAEFGSGNYPIDMVVVESEEGDQIIIANSNLPLIILDTAEIENFDGEILERPETYTAGVSHIKRSGTGIQQLDVVDNRYLVILKRMPSGTLDLGSQPLRRG